MTLVLKNCAIRLRYASQWRDCLQVSSKGRPGEIGCQSEFSLFNSKVGNRWPKLDEQTVMSWSRGRKRDWAAEMPLSHCPFDRRTNTTEKTDETARGNWTRASWLPRSANWISRRPCSAVPMSRTQNSLKPFGACYVNTNTHITSLLV